MTPATPGPDPSHPITRRDLLRRAGIAGGLLATGNVLAACGRGPAAPVFCA